MMSLARRTTALVAACSLLASCGGDGGGSNSSTIDEIQDSVSEGTGLDIGDDGPPQGTPEELLLGAGQIAGYEFVSETVDLDEIRDFHVEEKDQGFTIEPAGCDPTEDPGYLDALHPEKIAIRGASGDTANAEVSVSTELATALDLVDYAERCADIALRSDRDGLGEITTRSTKEIFEADTPSGVSDLIAFHESMTTGGSGVDGLMPESKSVTISGVVRERAVYVNLSSSDESTTAEQLTPAAEEIFAAQVEKIKDAE